MNQVQVINHRQLAWFVSTILTGGGLVSIQQEVIRLARMDAMFSYFGPLLYALLVGFFMYKLHKAFPGKTIFEINRLVAGRWCGSLITLVMLAFIWLVLVRDLSAVAQYIKSILLPNTPLEITLLLFMLLMIQFGRTSIEVLARVNDIVYPVYALLVFSLPLALSNELHTQLLEPFLTRPAGSILSASSLTAGWYGDIFVLGAFFPSIADSKRLLSALKHGTIMSVAMLSVFVGTEAAVFGSKVAGNMIYPSYSLVQAIHLSDFLDRIDLVVLSLWFPTIVVKIAVIYISFLAGLASLFKTRDYTMFNVPCSLFILVTSVYAFRNSSETFMFGNFSSLAMTLFLQVPLFLLLSVLAWVYRSKKPLPQSGNSGEEPRKKGAHMQVGWLKGLVQKVPLARWRGYTRVLLALCGCAIVVGLVYSRYFAVIGIVCCILYLLSLAMAILTSYCEMQRTA